MNRTTVAYKTLIILVPLFCLLKVYFLFLNFCAFETFIQDLEYFLHCCNVPLFYDTCVLSSLTCVVIDRYYGQESYSLMDDLAFNEA